MYNEATTKHACPRYLSSDNDPLFDYHRWKANMRILEIEEIKSVPYVPISHPFIERLIGSVRRELLDQVFFWNSEDLTRKLRLTTAILTPIARMLLGLANRQRKNKPTFPQTLRIIIGSLIVAACFNYLFLLESGISQAQANGCHNSAD